MRFRRSSRVAVYLHILPALVAISGIIVIAGGKLRLYETFVLCNLLASLQLILHGFQDTQGLPGLVYLACVGNMGIVGRARWFPR